MGYFSDKHIEMTLNGELNEQEPSYQDYPDEFTHRIYHESKIAVRMDSLPPEQLRKLHLLLMTSESNEEKEIIEDNEIPRGYKEIDGIFEVNEYLESRGN